MTDKAKIVDDILSQMGSQLLKAVNPDVEWDVSFVGDAKEHLLAIILSELPKEQPDKVIEEYSDGSKVTQNNPYNQCLIEVREVIERLFN